MTTTVLFCDIANSTPLAAHLGPEAIHTLLKRIAEDAGFDAIFAADQTNTLL
jgi:class 3 adenylate cyclase